MASLKNVIEVPSEQRSFQTQKGVVETVLRGRMTVKVVEAAFRDLERLGNGPVWLFDAIGVDSFESDVVRLGAASLPRLRRQGLRRIVGVIPSAALRMAARAAGVASGIDIRVVETRLEAMTLLMLES
jgi:hypothetical protein